MLVVTELEVVLDRKYPVEHVKHFPTPEQVRQAELIAFSTFYVEQKLQVFDDVK